MIYSLREIDCAPWRHGSQRNAPSHPLASRRSLPLQQSPSCGLMYTAGAPRRRWAPTVQTIDLFLIKSCVGNDFKTITNNTQHLKFIGTYSFKSSVTWCENTIYGRSIFWVPQEWLGSHKDVLVPQDAKYETSFAVSVLAAGRQTLPLFMCFIFLG